MTQLQKFQGLRAVLQGQSAVGHMPGYTKDADFFETIFANDKSLPFYLGSYRYGDEIVKDGKFQEPSFSRQLIGVPLNKTLEVSTTFERAENVHIRHPTTVLYPGDFFGLFETFAGLQGHWDISAGVKCLRILDTFGTERYLKKTKVYRPTADATKKHLTWDKGSRLQFHELAGRPSIEEWEAQVLYLPFPEEIKDPIRMLRYKDFLLQRTVEQLARLVGSIGDQRYRDDESGSTPIQVFRNLLEGTVGGTRCAYYFASTRFAKEIEVDLPYAAVLRNVRSYKESEGKPEELEHLPIFIPGLARADRPFRKHMFHFLDFEPYAFQHIATKEFKHAVEQLFPLTGHTPQRGVGRWLRSIPRATSVFRDSKNSSEAEVDYFTEAEFIGRYDSALSVIVRWYFNHGGRIKPDGKVENHLPASWLGLVLFGEELEDFIRAPMVVNILEVHFPERSRSAGKRA